MYLLAAAETVRDSNEAVRGAEPLVAAKGGIKHSNAAMLNEGGAT
jgi:hypothetical protein